MEDAIAPVAAVAGPAADAVAVTTASQPVMRRGKRKAAAPLPRKPLEVMG